MDSQQSPRWLMRSRHLWIKTITRKISFVSQRRLTNLALSRSRKALSWRKLRLKKIFIGEIISTASWRITWINLWSTCDLLTKLFINQWVLKAFSAGLWDWCDITYTHKLFSSAIRHSKIHTFPCDCSKMFERKLSERLQIIGKKILKKSAIKKSERIWIDKPTIRF